MNKGICQLCLEEKPLAKAHIISKFLFKPLKDDKNRMVGFSKTNINEFLQDGYWDRNILCEECDKHLGKSYEDPIAKIYYKHEGNPGNVGFIKNDDGYSFKAVNFDFNVLCKFILTQLWRMSISKIDAFSDTDLGLYHSEQIKLLLKKNRPVTGLEYPIMILVTPPHTKMIITPAVRLSYEGYKFYEFKIHQFVYWVFVNAPGHKIPDEIQKRIILKDRIIAYTAPKKITQDIDRVIYDIINRRS